MKEIISAGSRLLQRVIVFEQQVMKYFWMLLTVVIVNGVVIIIAANNQFISSDVMILVLVIDTILLGVLTFISIQYNIYKMIAGRYIAPVVKVVKHANTAPKVSKSIFKRWR